LEKDNIEIGRECWKNLAAAPLRDGYVRFLGKTEISHKVRCSVAPNFLKIRNCKVLEVLMPGFEIATLD
jgi:hypothetical protein